MKWFIVAVFLSSAGHEKEIILEPRFETKDKCEAALLVMGSGLVTNKVSLKCELEGAEDV